MSKLLDFDIVNNCNRDIIVKIGNTSITVNKGKTVRTSGKKEGMPVEVYPYNASYTRQVGTVTGSTIVISGYDK